MKKVLFLAFLVTGCAVSDRANNNPDDKVQVFQSSGETKESIPKLRAGVIETGTKFYKRVDGSCFKTEITRDDKAFEMPVTTTVTTEIRCPE